jgi:cytoskeletal protein CcmA (bactofilin family)
MILGGKHRMMAKRNGNELRRNPTGEISTLLGNDAEIRGTVTTKGSIRVDGAVIGEISSPETVTVGSTGSVEGNIEAEHIVVAGRVKGTLTARGRITLENTGRLDGDLLAAKLVIVEGAVFSGRCNMGERLSGMPSSSLIASVLEQATQAEL